MNKTGKEEISLKEHVVEDGGARHRDQHPMHQFGEGDGEGITRHDSARV